MNDGEAAPRNEAANDELALKRRETVVKEREVAVKEGELKLKRDDAASSAWRSPLVLSVLGAALAAAGNAGISFFNAKQQRELEDRKSEQARILEMIKTGSPDKAADNLQFLVDAGLITDKELSGRLREFLDHRKPGTGPALPTPGGNSIAERLAQTAGKPAALVPGDTARYHVVNHVLFDASGKPVTVSEAMSKGGGQLKGTRAIVLHFTADTKTNAAVQYMSASHPDGGGVGASAHIVIRRDGSVVQLVAFDVPAWHAGIGKWKDVTNLNQYTLGVMFENAGELKQLNGSWPLGPDNIFMVGPHDGKEAQAWERYTPAQLESARELIKALGRAYPSIEAVLRHSEVSPGRKVDPGPALDVGPLAEALEEGKRLAK